MNQPTTGLARHDHPDTSHAAAASVSGKNRQRVFLVVQARVLGATDEEIQVATGINPNSQRPRRVELVDRGYIKDSGRRRKTRSGRSAIVWVLA